MKMKNHKLSTITIAIIIALIICLMSVFGYCQTPSSHTISKTINVGEVLLLDLQGDVEIKSTKGTRVIIETKIQTNLPLNIQLALHQLETWYIVDWQDKATAQTVIQVKGFEKVKTYKNKDIEMKYSSTIYVPENVIVKRV